MIIDRHPARRAPGPLRWACLALLGVAHLAAAASAPETRLAVARLHATAPSGAMLWLGHGNRAQRALDLLRDAPAHGLDAAAYGVDELAQRLARQETGAAFDTDLSAAMLQYLSDLHDGRTVPDYPALPPAPAHADPVALLLEALASDQLDAAVQAAEPAIPLYHRVKTSLAHYRALAGQAAQWTALPPPAAGASVAPGAPYAGTPLLRERLRLLGDLDAANGGPESAADSLYTPALATAVRHFQARHGLAPDGKLGVATRAALAVPPERRVRQLELTLERLRWLAPLPRGRQVVVNLPTYRLIAFDNAHPGAEQPLEMRVIVGTAARTPTPLFIGQLRYLEFNPYWNVPPSIQAGEILPAFARNPGYLAQHDMELVSDKGQALPGSHAAQLAALRAGALRIRQRPGPRNVLGAVKFAMPNPMNIYLHSTSAQGLFGQSRRDLSHGCIRVEQPAELAQFVLADPLHWNAASVAAAMQPGPTRTVPLAQPVPVVLFYATALTDRAGQVHFADDIYGRDEKLLRALRGR